VDDLVIEFGAGSLTGCDLERGDRLHVEVPPSSCSFILSRSEDE